jgi:uncharacterized protein YndB with AHSA1/START domain
MPVEELSRIEKKVLVRAPRARVWKAISDPAEFSKWFRVKTDGEFRPGARAHMTSTYPGHEGVEFFIDIVEVEPERKLSWHWHPGGKNSDALNPADPPTLVAFELQEVQDGTLVTVTESGFDRLSLARRAKAFELNEHGWELQVENIRRYVEEAA